MNKSDWQKFIEQYSKDYDDSQDRDGKLYYPYISDEGFLKKDDFLKNLWQWKMQVHYYNKNSKKALKLMEGKKEKIRNFRKSKPSFDELCNFSREIFPTGLIYPIFLMHICKPEEYPIFDQHVFRAFTYRTKNIIVDKPKSIEDYQKYKEFVFQIKKYGFSLRSIDKSLMAYGQSLVNSKKILK